ncbi:MAG: PEP/pyruvate-binding domain-containing protein [Saprospiraceae bacterium]
MNYTVQCFFILTLFLNCHSVFGQQVVPIISHNTNTSGQVELEINSSSDKYYILSVRNHVDSTFDIMTSMVLGEDGTMIISESLSGYPIEHYQIMEYNISTPDDVDEDGIDDITEFQNIPTQSPINAAPEILEEDGLVFIDTFTTFKKLTVIKDRVLFSEFLNGKGFVKYIITDFYTNPKIYFINTFKHTLHADFANEIGINYLGNDIKKGQIIYHPTSFANNGTLGAYAFNYSNGFPEDFDVVRRTHELLAANMPFIENNLAYFITAANQAQYEQDSILHTQSRVPVLLEADAYGDVDYWGLNPSEGFGLFRQIVGDEVPGPKDIVLYEQLPNALPRVGGIMTSVIQTPLSHVNLRAIQNEIPNAFIRDPLLIDSIADLLNKYIYFKVEQDSYVIREATLEEVNTWFDNIRPTKEQTPPLNLDYTSILPLDDIKFIMFDGFGAKCANVATMRRFGFPDGTIPDGFGVPFYFYQEFMKHNGLFKEIETIINSAEFQADRNVRDEMLFAFREKIRSGRMPNWMLVELQRMQTSFPKETPIRVRSSTNNEDLPGFNGAGLYDSRTHYEIEGHIAKSIKQIYASLWNLRAFEERDFYRVNHFTASMGILCHPSYQDEKANGVGVSIDPIYGTSNTFYLNSQVGEELITNPSGTVLPEEILLDRVWINFDDYIVIQRSNLISEDSVILSRLDLNAMRKYLTTIHDEFAKLYHAEGLEDFAMDIEYKITSDDRLIIKQARPWVSFVLEEEFANPEIENIKMTVFPNPADKSITLACEECHITAVKITNILGQSIEPVVINYPTTASVRVDVQELPKGVYVISGFVTNNNQFYSMKFVKQ